MHEELHEVVHALALALVCLNPSPGAWLLERTVGLDALETAEAEEGEAPEDLAK